MNMYILYSEKYTDLIDSFSAIDGSGQYQENGILKNGIFSQYKVYNDGEKSLAVVNCFSKCFDKYIKPILNDGNVEILSSCNCRKKPCEHLSQDDAAKILAIAPDLLD